MPRPFRSNPKTRTYAIELRRQLAPSEIKLWAYLRNEQLGNRFSSTTRHWKIHRGLRMCQKKKLIIELDGVGTSTNGNTTMKERSTWEVEGYKVICFWNNQITNDINGVIKAIQLELMEETKE